MQSSSLLHRHQFQHSLWPTWGLKKEKNVSNKEVLDQQNVKGLSNFSSLGFGSPHSRARHKSFASRYNLQFLFHEDISFGNRSACLFGTEGHGIPPAEGVQVFLGLATPGVWAREEGHPKELGRRTAEQMLCSCSPT